MSSVTSCCPAVPPGTGTNPVSSVSTLQTLPARSSLSSRLVHWIQGRGIAGLVFKSPLFDLIMAQSAQAVMLAIRVCRREADSASFTCKGEYSAIRYFEREKPHSQNFYSSIVL